MNTKTVAAKIEELREKADVNERESTTARYRDDKESAQYYAGVCAGYRMAALEIEAAMRG